METDAFFTPAGLRTSIEEYASMLRTIYSQNTTRDLPSYVSLEEFALDFGRGFGYNRELPDDVARGEKKQCFMNAAHESLHSYGSLAYVEGFAFSKDLAFKIHHAWVVDEDGSVFDPTWDYAPGNALYFGIPFLDEYVRETLLREGYYGMLSPTEMFNRHLMGLKDQPEEFLHPWFSSEIMERRQAS